MQFASIHNWYEKTTGYMKCVFNSEIFLAMGNIYTSIASFIFPKVFCIIMIGSIAVFQYVFFS